uniref:Glutamic acid-rich protein-like n=1 Tax=Saccoglossus kowalevskii TaxID=10224 RepID=A0ABM0MUC5_SACKO
TPEVKKIKADTSPRVGRPHTQDTTRTLVVSGIPENATKEDIEKVVKRTNNVEQICFPVEENKQKVAHIRYVRCADAKNAIGRIKGKKFLGRTVAVDWAVPKLKYEDAMKQEKEKAERLKNEKKTETVEQSSNKKNTPKAQKEDKQRSKSSAKNDQNKQIIQKNVKPSKNQKDENSVKSLNKPDNLLKDKAKRTAQTIPENNKIKKQQIKDKKISKPEKKSLIEDDGDKEDGYHSDSDGDVSSECSVDEDDDDVDSDDEDDDDDEEEEEDDDDDDDEEKFSMKPKRPSDASEGKTLFVRYVLS